MAEGADGGRRRGTAAGGEERRQSGGMGCWRETRGEQEGRHMGLWGAFCRGNSYSPLTHPLLTLHSPPQNGDLYVNLRYVLHFSKFYSPY